MTCSSFVVAFALYCVVCHAAICGGFIIHTRRVSGAVGTHGRGLSIKNANGRLPSGVVSYGTVKAEDNREDEVTVFDAEGGMSWDQYKKQQPDEFKLNEIDKMLCWENDECPVEDEAKYTKAWSLRSAEKEPTTETHFDSEGEWEEENRSAWSKKWYEDVGVDDLREDPQTGAAEGYEI